MKPGDEIWITKDERLILVREMDDQHLLNTHRLVSKNGRSAKDLIGVLDHLHQEARLHQKIMIRHVIERLKL